MGVLTRHLAVLALAGLIAAAPAPAAPDAHADRQDPATAGVRLADADPEVEPDLLRDVWIYPRLYHGFLVVQLRTAERPRGLDAAHVYVRSGSGEQPAVRVDITLGDRVRVALGRVTAWRGAGTLVACPRLTGRVRDERRLVEVAIPWRCLATPAEPRGPGAPVQPGTSGVPGVRVAAEVWSYRWWEQGRPVAGVVDAVPGLRSLSTRSFPRPRR